MRSLPPADDQARIAHGTCATTGASVSFVSNRSDGLLFACDLTVRARLFDGAPSPRANGAQAWLVAEAEETMIEEEEGDAVFDAPKIRSAFDELDGLKRALGRSTFAALNALLPFSRNDYWEVSELKQRLGSR